MESIRNRMQVADVTRALCVCTTLEEYGNVLGLAQRFENIWCSVGVHPDNEGCLEPSVNDLLERSRNPRVIAIGETGLDYYRLNGRSVADMEWQRDRFRVHVRAAQRACKPLIVHTRDSSGDTLRILREEGEEPGCPNRAGGVFHCFTESSAVAREVLALGYYISFSGIITFKNAQALRDVVAMVPMDRILIETDSPYLAPVPFRGKTNDPSLVPYVAREIASIKGISEEEAAHATSQNFNTLFRLANA